MLLITILQNFSPSPLVQAVKSLECKGGSGGGGSAGSGKVTYPEYIQQHHAMVMEVMYGMGGDGFDDDEPNGKGYVPYRANHSPFESAVPYDPQDDLSLSQDQLDKYKNIAETLSEISTFDSMEDYSYAHYGLASKFDWSTYFDAGAVKSQVEDRLDVARLIDRGEAVLDIKNRYDWTANRERAEETLNLAKRYDFAKLFATADRLMEIDERFDFAAMFKIAQEGSGVASELGLSPILEQVADTPYVREFDFRSIFRLAEQLGGMDDFNPDAVFRRAIASLSDLFSDLDLDRPTWDQLLDSAVNGLKKITGQLKMDDWNWDSFYEAALEKADSEADFSEAMENLDGDLGAIARRNAKTGDVEIIRELGRIDFDAAHDKAKEYAHDDAESTDLIDQFTTAQDNSLSVSLSQKRARLAASMADIGAQNGSAFILADAILNANHLTDLAQFRAGLAMQAHNQMVGLIQSFLTLELNFAQTKASQLAQLLQLAITTSSELARVRADLSVRTQSEKMTYLRGLMQQASEIAQGKTGQQISFLQSEIAEGGTASRINNETQLRYAELRLRGVESRETSEQNIVKTRSQVIAELTQEQRALLTEKVQHVQQMGSIAAQVLVAKFSFLNQAAEIISRLATARVDALGMTVERQAAMERSKDAAAADAVSQIGQAERSKMTLYDAMISQISMQERGKLEYLSGSIAQMGALEDYRLRHRASGYDQVSRVLQMRLEAMRTSAIAQVDSNRIRIVAMKEMYDRDIELNTFDSEWPMHVITTFMGPMIGAAAGAVGGGSLGVAGAGAGGVGSALGGAMSGALSGAGMGAMIGSAIAPGVGTAVGAALGMWAGGGLGYASSSR